jgi:NAD(P)-dependent dehydrogenase (short-subunit alcohol dehydrogenase family)
MYPSDDRRGRVVLITGGRRVGSALARLLAGRGWNVAMTYFSSIQAIKETIAEVKGLGVDGLAVGADLSNADQTERAVARVVAEFGKIDALVNMVSVFRRTPFSSLTPDDFDGMIAANLAAPYHSAVAVARRMQAQPAVDGIKGKIVNIGDWATERPYKDFLPYLVAKGGLTTMTLALAKELAPEIPVMMIQPAMIDPPPNLPEAEIQAVIEQTPLKRCGRPDDVNRLILYLLEETNFVTGACFRVDGGRYLGED